jgi:hypothetical protein
VGGHGGRLKADWDPTARYLVMEDIDKCLVEMKEKEVLKKQNISGTMQEKNED